MSSEGNTLAVGARGEDSAVLENDNLASFSGAVYVFTRTGSTWEQQDYVKTSNRDVEDHFGESVALIGDGNTLAVSARLEDSAATGIDGDQGDNSAPSAGAVYIYPLP